VADLQHRLGRPGAAGVPAQRPTPQRSSPAPLPAPLQRAARLELPGPPQRSGDPRVLNRTDPVEPAAPALGGSALLRRGGADRVATWSGRADQVELNGSS